MPYPVSYRALGLGSFIVIIRRVTDVDREFVMKRREGPLYCGVDRRRLGLTATEQQSLCRYACTSTMALVGEKQVPSLPATSQGVCILSCNRGLDTGSYLELVHPYIYYPPACTSIQIVENLFKLSPPPLS